MNAVDRWKALIVQVGCLVCRRLGRGAVPPQLHHTIGDNPFSLVPLCPEHHDPDRTGSGFHGMGEQRFCLIFKVPGLCEFGLFVWLHEDLARFGPRML